jgi:hypothetical protein
MQKIAIGLTVLLLLAAVSKPAAAQEAIVYPQIPCIWYEAVEFPGCVNYGTLSEEEARTARGHPEFVEPVQAATASQAQPPPQTARIVPSSRQ